MNESKQAPTPGPWKTGRANDDWSIDCETNGATWIAILAQNRASPIAFAVENYGDGDEAIIANARLIAAAPDLLAALEVLVDQIDPSVLGYHVARRALSKSRGEGGK